MRLIGDQIHRVLLGFMPLSPILAYGSSIGLVLVIRWAKQGKPRGFLVSWLQHHFRLRTHAARSGEDQQAYLTDEVA